jgi:hypothetical protein
MVSNISSLQFPKPRSASQKCNLNAVLGCAGRGAIAAFLCVFLPIASYAQDGPAGSTVQAATEEHPVADTAQFLAGGAVALAAHEGGHLIFDVVFQANPRIEAIHFGPFPFFAVTHDSGQPPRREFTISSAGFWVQEATNEYLLTSRPSLRGEHAPLAKGVFVFNVLNSVGYGIVAFAKAGPYERDTRGMAQSVDVPEPAIGALVMAPALLDAYRYFRPNSQWAKWASRAVKVGSVLLVAKGGR